MRHKMFVPLFSLPTFSSPGRCERLRQTKSENKGMLELFFSSVEGFFFMDEYFFDEIQQNFGR